MTQTPNTAQKTVSQDTPFRKVPSPSTAWTIASASAFVKSEEAVENGGRRGQALHYLIDCFPSATGDNRAQILSTISIAKSKHRFFSKSVRDKIDANAELRAVVATAAQST